MSGETIVALSGGIGGAKLALGLYRVLPPGSLTVICNPGDDFDHLGLRICPDTDTVLYTLAGIANPQTGWGRADETWTFMQVLADLDGETWFQLGDGDLALHVERTYRLAGGESLSRIAEDMAWRLGVRARVVPACDSPVRTVVRTPNGRMAFQHYFVRDRCEPAVTGFDFEGVETARPCDAALEALSARSLRCVVVCPSNPFISIAPILAVPGMKEAIRAAAVPVIGVSPIIGGSAVKGPTAKMMRELGIEISNRSIERHYEGIVDAWLIDPVDARDTAGFDRPVRVAPTLMRTDADKDALAREVLEFAVGLRASPRFRGIPKATSPAGMTHHSEPAEHPTHPVATDVCDVHD